MRPTNWWLLFGLVFFLVAVKTERDAATLGVGAMFCFGVSAILADLDLRFGRRSS